MKKLSSIITLLFFSFPMVGWCQPVYLKCQSVSKPKRDFAPFTVKIDEASEKITHTNEDGSAYRTIGFFSESKIRYKYLESPIGDP